MAEIGKIGLQNLGQIQNTKGTQSRGYAYLLNQPIEDKVELSSSKKAENKSPVKNGRAKI